MKRTLTYIGMLLFLAVSSNVAAGPLEDFSGNINPGFYYSKSIFYFPDQPEESRGDTPPFKISRRGNIFIFTDTFHKIQYRLDLEQKTPQNLPKQYIDFLNNDPLLGEIGAMVKSISIANIRAGQGTGQILADVIVDIRYQSKFGFIQARLILGASANSSSCEYNDWDDKTQKPVQYNGTCMTATVGDSASVVALSSSMGESYDRFTRFVFDFGVRLFSPRIRTTERLWEIRK